MATFAVYAVLRVGNIVLSTYKENFEMKLLCRLRSLFGRESTNQSLMVTQINEPELPTKKQRVQKELAKQSPLRWLIFYCIFGLHVSCADEVDETSEAAFDASIQRYYEAEYRRRIEQRDGSGPDFCMALSAAGLLIYGSLDTVEVILDNVTIESYRTDHGAGRGNLLPMLAITTVLPIPGALCTCNLTEGRIDIAGTRAWFRANQEHLFWNENTKRFVLTQTASK